MKIISIGAREIYNSRGLPTIECELIVSGGHHSIAAAPAGASVGRYEAFELRDGDPQRFNGTGVLQSIEIIKNIIGPTIIGLEPNFLVIDQILIDLNKVQPLGANTMLAVSCAVAKAQAFMENIELYELFAYAFGTEEIELPRPWFNMINGGAHSNNNLNIQEFMIIPVQATSFKQAYEDGIIFFQNLKQVLKKHNLSIAVGDEGGFAPQINSDFDAITLLIEVFENIDPNRYRLALDVAASQLYDPLQNKYKWDNAYVEAQQLIDFYCSLAHEIPLVALEDPLAEDDWENWSILTKSIEGSCITIGDDLFATNTHRIHKGIEVNAAQGVIIKPNQRGTLSQALQAIKFSKEHDLLTIVSHRSGETEDTLLADLCVGSCAGNIKAGGCSRGERIAKYNRLLRIEDHLSMNFSS